MGSANAITNHSNSGHSTRRCLTSTVTRCIVLALALLTSCGNEELPELGHHFENGLSESTRQYIYVGYKQKVNGIHMTSGGVAYLIGLKHGKDVVYIGTMDPRFNTPEGYSLESTYQDIINGTGGGQVKLDYGWG
jgi:hypothetical protein